MKMHTPYLSTLHDVSALPLPSATDDGYRQCPACDTPEFDSQADARALPRSLRIVGIMAFSQSLLFLVIWLFICFAAKAGKPPAVDPRPVLQPATYNPTKKRDPFDGFTAGVSSTVTKAVTVDVTAFKLQGILYQPINPSAIVNDQLVTVDKTISLDIGGNKVEVKVVQITRDLVVLDVSGQRVELRLNGRDPAAK